MPFIAILKELVSSVDGAEGAIVIEADGEAVQWYATGDEDLLRLRAAYVALAAQACRETAARLGLNAQDAVLKNAQRA